MVRMRSSVRFRLKAPITKGLPQGSPFAIGTVRGIDPVTSSSRVADERAQHRAWQAAGRSRRAACVAREHRRASSLPWMRSVRSRIIDAILVNPSSKKPVLPTRHFPALMRSRFQSEPLKMKVAASLHCQPFS